MNKKNILIFLLGIFIIFILCFFNTDLKNSLQTCFNWISEQNDVKNGNYPSEKYDPLKYKRLEEFKNYRIGRVQKNPVVKYIGEGRKGKVYWNPENSILGFRFDKGDMLKDKDLVTRYGEGCPIYEEGVLRRRYKVGSSSSTIVVFGSGDTSNKAIGFIEIREENIVNSCISKVPFKLLKTGKGLILDDNIYKVKKLYPNPAYISDENKKEYSNLNQICPNKLCYILGYIDWLMFSKNEDPDWFPPYSLMEIKICDSKVKSIRLELSHWTSDYRIISADKEKTE